MKGKIQKILIATTNQGKLEEIEHYFKDFHIKFCSLRDFPKMPEVIEDGETLVENAKKKAAQTANFTKMITLADDTGLEVEYLNNEPGVYSARYAGENATYADNNEKLLKKLKNIPLEKRKATFKTVMALAFPVGEIFTVEGKCNGLILEELRGTNGFGYDPIFFVPEINKTFAEMNMEEKNKISHRAKALENIKKLIQKLDSKP